MVEFIAEVAWPAAILIVALVYRRLVGDLIAGGITRLRAGPFELAWDRAKSGLESSRPPSQIRSASDSSEAVTGASFSFLDPKLVDLASSNPRQAVLCAYEAVQEALRTDLSDLGVTFGPDLDALALAREAESRGIVPPEVTDAVLGLNILHNLAKHAPVRDMSPAKAYEFLAMADGALYSLTTAMKKRGKVSQVARAA